MLTADHRTHKRPQQEGAQLAHQRPHRLGPGSLAERRIPLPEAAQTVRVVETLGAAGPEDLVGEQPGDLRERRVSAPQQGEAAHAEDVVGPRSPILLEGPAEDGYHVVHREIRVSPLQRVDPGAAADLAGIDDHRALGDIGWEPLQEVEGDVTVGLDEDRPEAVLDGAQDDVLEEGRLPGPVVAEDVDVSAEVRRPQRDTARRAVVGVAEDEALIRHDLGGRREPRRVRSVRRVSTGQMGERGQLRHGHQASAGEVAASQRGGDVPTPTPAQPVATGVHGEGGRESVGPSPQPGPGLPPGEGGTGRHPVADQHLPLRPRPLGEDQPDVVLGRGVWPRPRHRRTTSSDASRHESLKEPRHSPRGSAVAQRRRRLEAAAHPPARHRAGQDLHRGRLVATQPAGGAGEGPERVGRVLEAEWQPVLQRQGELPTHRRPACRQQLRRIRHFGSSPWPRSLDGPFDHAWRNRPGDPDPHPQLGAGPGDLEGDMRLAEHKPPPVGAQQRHQVAPELHPPLRVHHRRRVDGHEPGLPRHPSLAPVPECQQSSNPDDEHRERDDDRNRKATSELREPAGEGRWPVGELQVHFRSPPPPAARSRPARGRRPRRGRW